MKYVIVVKKYSANIYAAYSPRIKSLRAVGGSVNGVLEKITQKMTCYLHDPKAQLEIVVDDRDQGTQQQSMYTGREG